MVITQTRKNYIFQMHISSKLTLFLEEEKLKKDTLTTSRWKHTRYEKEMT